jgi:alpha-L-fucosidase
MSNAVEHTMRAVDVDGGTDVRVTGNAAADGDSGCVLQGGASNVEVTGNYWERCRVGLLAWGAGQARDRDNTCADLIPDGADRVVGP